MLAVPSLTLALVAASVLLVQDSIAAPITLRPPRRYVNRLQVFGDSLSDDGHGAWNISNHTWPSDPHYYGHRFTNGFVHAEVLAHKMSVPFNDSAIGGATTNNKLVQGYTGKGSTIKVPSILDQIARFIDPPLSDFPGQGDDISRPPIDRILFMIYGGGNDAIFGEPNVTAKQVASDIRRSIKNLRDVGAQYFLLPTLPPLGHLNKVLGVSGDYFSRFSSELRSEIFKIARSDPSIVVADIYPLFQAIVKDPSKYGYKVVDDACLKGVYSPQKGGVTICHKPDTYLYFDDYHPGSRAHQMMGEIEYNALKSRGWIA